VSAPENRHRPVYLWHPKIHSSIRNERLIYALAAFEPVYRRDRAVGEIERAFTDLGIHSYSLWELIGDHDIMIQAWVPATISVEAFQAKIIEFTTVEAEIMPMVVDTFIDHWMWKDLDIDLPKAEAEISSEDYRDLNRGVVPAGRLKKYREAGYIQAAPNSKRLKFFVRITNPNRPIKPIAESQIWDNVRELFGREYFSNGVALKVSGFATYLITGRLLSSQFPAIGTEFQPTFANSGVLEALRSRTITHLSALHGPVARVEQLLPLATPDIIKEPSDRDLESWLMEGESDYLEFKASSYTDIDHKVGRRKGNTRGRAEQLHEIAKAVCGMLNADGGIIIIGVAELAQYSKEELIRAYPGAAMVKDLMVIGVDAEFPRGGWDPYQRALARDLRKAIDGEFDGWVRYQHLQYDGKSACIIRVRRPPTFYYVRDKDKHGAETVEFFGRTGGETRRLLGRQMDDFKEAHPRITRTNSG